MAEIRREKPEDIEAIHHVNELAFGRANEADLVDALRSNGKVVLSLVAIEGGQVAGHVLFSPMTIESSEGACPAVALGPVAVLPKLQRRGIGSALIRLGLAELRNQGHERVILLGHPNYYPRFGFVRASSFGVRSEFSVSDEVFMALELRKGAFEGCAGVAKYQPEFNDV